MPPEISRKSRRGWNTRPLPALLGMLVLPTSFLFAQDNIPSPASVMRLPDDTTKVMQLSDLCFAYRRVDVDSAELFGQAALRLAGQLQYRRGEAQAYNDLAILRIDHSEYGMADSLLRRSLSLRTALGDSGGMAAVHNKLGIIYQAQFMFEEALEEDLKALAIYERTGPPAHEATLLNNIGVVQFNLGRLSAALATHQRAAAIRAEVGDSVGVAASIGNLANVELQMGDTTTAMEHYREAISFFRRSGMKSELAVQLHNLANIELVTGDLPNSARNHKEALELRQGLGEPKAISSSLIGLGGVRLAQGRHREAGLLLHEGLALARKTNSRHEEMKALLDLARLHAGLNHGDSSFLFHQAYSILRDSVFNADMIQRLAVAETRFETEKKEREIQGQRAAIAELERESGRRQLGLVAALGGLVAVVLGALLLMQVQQKRARRRHDAAIILEREAGLRGVLDATESERKRIARELHDGIGQQVAGLKFRLEDIASKTRVKDPVPEETWSEALSITGEVGQEVRNIAHALMPRALEQIGLAPAVEEMLERSLTPAGIGHAFEQHGLEDRLPRNMEVSLYRIAQELVQNTLKHAGADRVEVQLSRIRDQVLLIYQDNGRGLQAGDMQTGIGLRNIHERARALNGRFIMESGPAQGFQATLRIPWSGEV